MGPLAGFKVIEMKGIGPGPYAGQLLADMGAEVIVVERSSKPSGISIPAAMDISSRGKRNIALNLKSEEGLEALLKLVEGADALFEGFRPGVTERLGYGPDVCLARNPKLVYGRMTGWGQTGPLSHAAGHDINYISLTGSLAAIGKADAPVPPLNLIGDYAGGSLFLVMGMLAAMMEAQKSGKGQVVDTAITDGSASLMSMFYTLNSIGAWGTKRESNMLDGGTPFYGAYETSDAKFVSVGPLEPQFFAELVEKAGFPSHFIQDQHNAEKWPAMKAAFIETFKTKTRDEWAEIFEGSDACVAPVLNFKEAVDHPHNQARGTYIDIAGVQQPAPAPQFSRTVCDTPSAPRAEGSDTAEVLNDWGFSATEIDTLKQAGVLT